jgi:ribosome maturation factor RimP
MSEQIKSIIEQLMEPYTTRGEYELVDVEFVKEGSNRFLRVFIDKDGGVDIDDCGRVSEHISQHLDEKDPIEEAYFLEVSSPGAERPLKKPDDFYKAIHKHVFITTYEPIGSEKEFEGELLSFNGEEAIVKIAKKEVVIPYPKMASARLAIIF